MKAIVVLLVLAMFASGHSIITSFPAPDDNITGLTMGELSGAGYNLWALTGDGIIYRMDLSGTVIEY